jgi:hypothetical protein
MTSARVRAEVGPRIARLVGSIPSRRPSYTTPLHVGDEMFSMRQPEADEQVQAGDGRRAGAGAHELHVADVLADHSRPLRTPPRR